MTSYLGDLMEDTTNFSWQGTKGAHAVILCEMESGTLSWEDTERIDWVCRAHAQKHVPSSKQNWVRGDKSLGFAKAFSQTLAPIRKIMSSMVV